MSLARSLFRLALGERAAITSGTLQLDGLRAPVTIRRTAERYRLHIGHHRGSFAQ